MLSILPYSRCQNKKTSVFHTGNSCWPQRKCIDFKIRSINWYRSGILLKPILCLLFLFLLSARSPNMIYASNCETYESDQFAEFAKVYHEKPAVLPETTSGKSDLPDNISGISLAVRNASLQDIASCLAAISGKNIVADIKCTDPVTLSLKNVSLPTALEILTSSQGLAYTDQDDTILISKDDFLKKQAAGFYTFPVNYIRAEEVQKSLATVLNGGKIAADAGSNSLLYNGSPAEARKIEKTLQKIDIPSQQVTLEAKILSIDKSEEKNIGLLWNWDSLPQYIANRDNNDDNSSSENSTASADRGHLRLWNKSHARFSFNVALNALITTGKAKVLATPSLITLPGKEASIFIGSHIPVVTEKHNNGESTYSTEFVDAGIKLQYTPIISRDGFITSIVHTEVSTPTLISELKNYRINSRTTDTTVRMRDGETLVIGGLINEEEQKQLQQIPLLSKIPLLGELFKNRRKSKSRTEVIMLLTPYLSDAGRSPAIYGKNETLLYQKTMNP